MKKRVKRKFNPLKFLSFIAFIIICYFLTMYLLDIKTKNIVVLNNNYYSDEKIIETAGIESYPKFLSLNTNKIKKKLLKLDLIENVTIKKKWNFVLELTIKEKKILYLVRSENKYRLSDNKLYDLELIKKAGLFFGNVRIGQDLNFYLKYLLKNKKKADSNRMFSRF